VKRWNCSQEFTYYQIFACEKPFLTGRGRTWLDVSSSGGMGGLDRLLGNLELLYDVLARWAGSSRMWSDCTSSNSNNRFKKICIASIRSVLMFCWGTGVEHCVVLFFFNY
jgi:hypothetical protein